MADFPPSLLIDSEQVIALCERVGGAKNRFQIQALAHCPSTNSLLLKQASDGAASGSVIVVDSQSAGRGSRGRSWQSSPEASLAFSLLWTFESSMAELSGLSLAVGVAVVRALKTCGAQDVFLKWPNDILTSQGKLGGILIELAANAKTTSAVIGIGLNLHAPFVPKEAFALPVSALDAVLAQEELPTRAHLLAELLIALSDVLTIFQAHGFAALREEWQNLNAWQDKSVCLVREGKIFQRGICLGADDEGALLLNTGNGIERHLSGDVSLGQLRPLVTSDVSDL